MIVDVVIPFQSHPELLRRCIESVRKAKVRTQYEVVIVDERGRYRVNPAAARILARPPGEFRDGIEASAPEGRRASAWVTRARPVPLAGG